MQPRPIPKLPHGSKRMNTQRMFQALCPFRKARQSKRMSLQFQQTPIKTNSAQKLTKILGKHAIISSSKYQSLHTGRKRVHTLANDAAQIPRFFQCHNQAYFKDTFQKAEPLPNMSQIHMKDINKVGGLMHTPMENIHYPAFGTLQSPKDRQKQFTSLKTELEAAKAAKKQQRARIRYNFLIKTEHEARKEQNFRNTKSIDSYNQTRANIFPNLTPQAE